LVSFFFDGYGKTETTFKIKTMIDEIKSLYKSFRTGKNIFIGRVAIEFGMQPLSIRNNWFGPFWQIPIDKQARLLEMLKEETKSRKTVA
jgi:hypothetical protein